MNHDFLKLLEEWRYLTSRTSPPVQNKIPGKEYKFPPMNSSEMSRRKEIAKILCNNINELNIKPAERYEIRKDCRRYAK